MPIIRPFRSVRPAVDKVSAIAALPYDVYDRREAKEIVEHNPLSFLKIDRAETQFPDGTDMYSQEIYERARQTLHEMIGDGSFVRDEKPCFYLYALTLDGRTQTGIVGCASVDDYLNGAIRRHENTKADKEKDRTPRPGLFFWRIGSSRSLSRLRMRLRARRRSMILYRKTESGIRYGRSGRTLRKRRRLRRRL